MRQFVSKAGLWGRRAGRGLGLVAYEAWPVGGEEPEEWYVQAQREPDQMVQARAADAGFDAADLFVAHAGDLAEVLLGQVAPVADVAEVAPDAVSRLQDGRVGWIFGHTETLEVITLRVPTKYVELCDLEWLLIDGPATDRFARMTVEHVGELAVSVDHH